MANRIVICPICEDKTKINLKKGQTNRRCEKCSRIIRVLFPPKKVKKKKSKKR